MGVFAAAALVEGIVRPGLAWRPLVTVLALALMPALLWRRGRPLMAALIGWGGNETSDVRMISQQAGDRASQGAGAVAVNDADLAQACERSFVEKLIDGVDSFIGSPADDVQFRFDLLLRGREVDLRAG